ncbi:chemotaxis response regulator protein-glutamate methylesterase [Leptospira levettii]|uniref:protein-glutamate methylesterase/protein-glutamine glutaminase n=1 Tax=Leptospira levettii TaxID=2023178 RepID=UPI0010926956|nr:chemotaxis response regulator protein-glutamate methylesterase [Leptospira levettii]TGM76457.1 chemotaxis response regulator protein-glutamate methylesterase [Leptospira levettii]
MIKLLIVDDQNIVRNVLSDTFKDDPTIKVVGTAANANEAQKLVESLRPDVISLDVVMPGMSGIEFLNWLMPKYPTPVIMLSTFTQSGADATLAALSNGAVDFVQKPDGSESDFLRMLKELTTKIKKYGTEVNLQKQSLFAKTTKLKFNEEKNNRIKIIAIGASTGGTQAIDYLLSRLPSNLPPIVIVQHMPEYFTSLFAMRLKTTSGLNVIEASNGDILETGGVYLAPGDKHLLVRRLAGKMYLELETFEKVSGHRPSVDVMFDSIAKGKMGNHCLAIILTGMGRDGASGIKNIRTAGGTTIGQDEKSSVVYGMPKEAFLLGGINHQTALVDIPQKIIQILET